MADDKKDKAAKDKGSKDKGGGAPKEAKEAKGGDKAKGGGAKAGKEGKKGKAAESHHAHADDGAPEQVDPNYKPRLRLHYQGSVIPALTKRFSYKNPMMVPRLQK